MDFKVASRTDRGRVREKNEDAVLAEEFPLIAVADGMGGHRAGEVASSMAVEILAQWKEKLSGTSGNEAADKLREALAEANRTIWERGQQDSNLQGMGTTVTAAWIDGDTIALAHVGDTRAYLLRGDKLQQLTHDQNVASDLVRRGRLSEAEAASSPQRHVLLQAIGAEPEGLDIEVASVQLQAGDRLLLATDGLHGMLRSSDRIRDILVEQTDPDEACRVLVDEANAAGGEDNISVLVLDIISTDEHSQPVSGDAEVRIDRPPPPPRVEAEASARPRARYRWPIVAGVAAIVVVLLGAILVMRINNSTLLVAERNGNVVALKGRAGTEGERATGDVVRVLTSVPAGRFPRPVREDLREGVPVDSMAEARRVVNNYIRLITPEKTPTPSPSPSPSPSGASALPLDGGVP
jgi:protein phosphatase